MNQAQTESERGAATGEQGGSWAEFTSSVSAAVREGFKLMERGMDRTADVADAAYLSVEKAIKRAPELVVGEVGRLLDFIASEPNGGKTMMEELVATAPGIGTVKLYADAWKQYHKGLAEGDQAEAEKGREACVRACLMGLVDLAALGSAAVTKPAAPLGRFITTASFLRLAALIPQVEEKVITPIVKSALSRESIRKMADDVLTSVKPPAEQVDTAAATGA